MSTASPATIAAKNLTVGASIVTRHFSGPVTSVVVDGDKVSVGTRVGVLLFKASTRIKVAA